jgi:hypothetical protein
MQSRSGEVPGGAYQAMNPNPFHPGCQGALLQAGCAAQAAASGESLCCSFC